MNLSNIALTFLAVLIASVSGEDIPSVEILTLITFDQPFTPEQEQSINAAMTSLAPQLYQAVNNVTVPTTRQLRINNERNLPICNQCLGYASFYTMCYEAGRGMRDRCRRALTLHEDLAEDTVAGLNADDRRRHLQIATLCREAKEGVTEVIVQAETQGNLIIPAGSKVTELCFYVV